MLEKLFQAARNTDMLKLVGVVAVYWKGRKRTESYLGRTPAVPCSQDSWFGINTKAASIMMIVSMH